MLLLLNLYSIPFLIYIPTGLYSEFLDVHNLPPFVPPACSTMYCGHIYARGKISLECLRVQQFVARCLFALHSRICCCIAAPPAGQLRRCCCIAAPPAGQLRRLLLHCCAACRTIAAAVVAPPAVQLWRL